jgi:hypothetical protein
LRFSYLKLLRTDQPLGSDESQDRARLARVQSIHGELRGRFILKQKSKIVERENAKIEVFSNY